MSELHAGRIKVNSCVASNIGEFDDIRIVEHLEDVWSHLPMNQIWEERLLKGKMRVFFACRVDELKVLLIVIIGPRSGISEQIYVIDSRKHIVTERLVGTRKTTIGDGILLPLSDMRNQVRGHGENPYEVCCVEMNAALQKLSSSISGSSSVSELRLISSGCSSSFLSAGSPGLGSRC